MKTYNIIYTIDNIECQINVNAHSKESALKIVQDIIPSASKITFIS